MTFWAAPDPTDDAILLIHRGGSAWLCSNGHKAEKRANLCLDFNKREIEGSNIR